MYTVKVSPKFQVVIPLGVRRALKVNPGEKFQVLPYQGRIELVPLKSIKKMRGFAKGIDSTIKREADRIL